MDNLETMINHSMSVRRDLLSRSLEANRIGDTIVSDYLMKQYIDVSNHIIAMKIQLYVGENKRQDMLWVSGHGYVSNNVGRVTRGK